MIPSLSEGCLPADVLQAYSRLVETGKLKPDHNQYLCAQRFQTLLEELSSYSPAVAQYEEEAGAYRQKRRELRQMLAERDSHRADTNSVGDFLLSLHLMH